MTDLMSDLFGSPECGLIDTFGSAIVQRALELAKGQPPEANIMPYIQRALDEARSAVEPPTSGS